MRLAALVFAALIVSAAAPLQPGTDRDAARVLRARLEDEAITPVTARFVERLLAEAATDGATCVVIELDTPGGLVTATRRIVMAILESPVPVVVYVSPSGARAASAGVFITLAAHVAAMAPATHIGAAHPVQIGGMPQDPSRPTDPAAPGEPAGDRPAPSSVMEEKLVNDATAWARTLAERRGRNAAWAAAAVAESASITASEAVDQHVVDLVAADLDALLSRIDGREVEVRGRTVRLDTRDAVVRTYAAWWGERLLGVLSNPNIAFLLLMLGFYGLLFEFYTPGGGVAGALGAVCLVLAFFGLAVLPVSFAGLALLGVALALFVAEAHVGAFGGLAVGGAVCLLLGGLMLVDTPERVMQVSTVVVVPVAVGTLVISLFLLTAVVRVRRVPIQTGSETLVGGAAFAAEAFVPKDGCHRGFVRAHGELWQARSEAPVGAGAVVRITGRDGLLLAVAPAETPAPSLAPPAPEVAPEVAPEAAPEAGVLVGAGPFIHPT